MRFLHTLFLLMLGLAATQAMAWGNHTLVSYRAFEKMPEVAGAGNVTAEPLEAFLRAEETTVEALLASQEAWALANLENYPKRPVALAFRAGPARSDEAQRSAFLMALRVAPNSRFALYFQPDPWSPVNGTGLPNGVVSTLPDSSASGRKFLALKPGEQVSALQVLASACDEPDYGMDSYLWEDSPSEWGKIYGFGAQPFGNTALAWVSQAPFHMGFMHESQAVYLAAPFAKRTFVLLRSQQYATLSALAFRTGHAYWGWRFAGMSLHYVQDLTQPYHASVAPGLSGFRLVGAHALALAGLPGMRNDLMALQYNRGLVLEKYLTESLQRSANRQQESALERALRNTERDKSYPDWSERYLRDLVSLQASKAGAALAPTLVTVMPAAYVSDPDFDFASRDTSISLLNELGRRDDADRVRLDSLVADLLVNFGAHSRNALRGILRVGDPP
jgi:hypothetical protein